MLSFLVLLLVGVFTLSVSGQLTVTSPVLDWGPPANTYTTLQDIAVDGSGNVYVVDSGITPGGSQVWKFSPTGVEAGAPYPLQASTAMRAPYGIDVNAGLIFVADSQSRSGSGTGFPRLVVFDATTGAELHAITITGAAQDSVPRHLTSNAAGTIAYVPIDNQIFIVPVNGGAITSLDGSGGVSFASIGAATSVQVDPHDAGALYIADSTNKRVSHLDISTNTITNVILSPDQSNDIADIDFDTNNDLYIISSLGGIIYQMVGISTTKRTEYSSVGLQTASVTINPSNQVLVGDTESQHVLTFNQATINGDPQFVGFQHQSFQVHGGSGDFFNLVTSPSLQLNSRFIYLASGSCTYNETECWTHPGTYVDQLGFMLPGLRIQIIAGPHSKGMHLMINDQSITPSNQQYHIPVNVSYQHKHVDIHYISIGHVMIMTPLIAVDIMNSDSFFNLAMSLQPSLSPLLKSGRIKHTIKSDAHLTTFYPDFPLHGLVGQTWRNARYPQNAMYQGDITDYMIEGNQLFATTFTYNLYQH